MSSNNNKEVVKKEASKKDMNTAVLQKIIKIAKPKKRSVSKLVQLCKEGDKDAFRELYDRHVAGVSRHITLLLGPGEDVDDLVQLVFLNVFQSIGKFRGASAFSTWLFRITINVARQEIRGKSRKRKLVTAVQDVTDITRNAGTSNPENTLSDIEQVYRHLKNISDKKRETFILYTYEGYSLEEIAELLGSTVSTIGSRLQSARKEIIHSLASGRK
ncbi:MAG: RNA polymerase sigma factor [Deltaproteobacteria bacterium]|nr:RNA polymerase sigma factor [Deltaproteobacteria bacterium]